MQKTIHIHFLGASQTVTGSKFLIETPEHNILVDCGVFQGIKELRELNWTPFPFPPEEINIVLLTHGHLDHCGYLPKLVQQGFQGPIKGTAPTLGIASVILRDSASLHEEDAERANKEGFSSHHPALPFYTQEDAENTIKKFVTSPLDLWISITKNIQYRHRQNGHILGATFIELEIYGKRIVFSGDIGRQKDPLLPPPEKPEWADLLFLESTYGDRCHPDENTDAVLTDIVHQTLKQKGTLIIPSFAVERLQTLMYTLWQLYKKNEIPNIPVFIDSPMGNEVLQLFRQYTDWHKLSGDELEAMFHHFTIITSYKDTWKTIDNKRSKIVIAGSGMVTGGRVLTYLRYYLDKPETTVLLAGYQAEGTRGRQLQEGAHEIKIHGKYIPVKAKVLTLQNLSAHADQKELLQWVSDIKNIPEEVFLVHGEKTALDSLRVKLKDTLQWNAQIPHLNEKLTLHFMP